MNYLLRINLFCTHIFCTLAIMENRELLDKLMEFAKNGKGRRMLNALNMKDNDLTPFQRNEVLKAYGEIGLMKEVGILKKMRGILRDDQYQSLAEDVRANCCSEKYDDFAVSLRNLLSCGMKMNPARNNPEEQV